jgi:mono/diheme cytochrome c family protein
MQRFGRNAKVLKRVLAVAAAAVGLPAAVAAQAAVDAALLARGEAVFAENCVFCHQEQGQGQPPNFPALAQNAKLADSALVIENVTHGKGNMPAFPDLTAEDVAAVATYVRNSWGNAHGGVTVEEVTTAMASLAAPAPSRSIWDGVYTEAQAARGAEAYKGVCSTCHGSRLDGAPDDPDQPSGPPLARAKFLRNWDNRSLGTLFEFNRASMPKNNPGYMTDQQYADLIAYMLSTSKVPAGAEELSTDPAVLSHIKITQKKP